MNKYLFYISLGVFFAILFYQRKIFKTITDKLNEITNLIGTIQQVPVLGYDDSGIKKVINDRFDEVENLIHYTNDNIIQSQQKPNKQAKDMTPMKFTNKSVSNVSSKSNSHSIKLIQQKFDDSLEVKSNASTSKNRSQQSNSSKMSKSEKVAMYDTIFMTSQPNNVNSETINLKPDNQSLESNKILSEDGVKSNVVLESEPLNEDLTNHLSASLEEVLNDMSKSPSKQNCNSQYEKLSVKSEVLDNNSNKNGSNDLDNEHKSHHSTLSSNMHNYPKLTELKKIAQGMGLSTSGNKKDLIQRLLIKGYVFN